MCHDYLISINLKICLNPAAAQPGTEIFNLPAVTTSGKSSESLLKTEHYKETVGRTLSAASHCELSQHCARYLSAELHQAGEPRFPLFPCAMICLRNKQQYPALSPQVRLAQEAILLPILPVILV